MACNKKIVYVDMDNVLVDFQSGIDAMQDVITSEYDGRIDEVPGVFAHMKPLPGAVEAYMVRRLCDQSGNAGPRVFLFVTLQTFGLFHKRQLVLLHSKN